MRKDGVEALERTQRRAYNQDQFMSGQLCLSGVWQIQDFGDIRTPFWQALFKRKHGNPNFVDDRHPFWQALL